MVPCILEGSLLSPLSPDSMRWIPDAALVIDEQNRIAWVDEGRLLPEQFASLPRHRTEGILLPGFVDLHVHLPQFDTMGRFGTSLMEWLDRFIFPEERRFAEAEVARDMARRFFAGLRDAGTTTAVVFSSVHRDSTHIAFEEAERSGLRIIMGKVHMDRHVPADLCEDLTAARRDAEELIERWHRKTERLWYAVTPRFAPACSAEMLSLCGELARLRDDLYVQTHINESVQEIAIVRDLFPERAHYTGVYEHAGLLGPRTILAHNIHPMDSELDLCEQRHCAVAHCPDSNLFLGSGRFPWERYEGRDIRIGLGSDVGAGTALDMFTSMRSMSHVQGRSLHPFLPFYTATLGGARALGLEDRIGSLDVGKEADVLIVESDAHYPGGKSLVQLSAVEAASTVVYRVKREELRIKGKERRVKREE